MLDEVVADRVHLVGGKASNLARLAQWGFPVPPGIVISSAAYDQFLDAGLRGRLEAALAQLSEAQESNVRPVELQTAFIGAGLPGWFEEQLFAAHRSLQRATGEPHLPLAVRSSATGEDQQAASFAGQYDSYLNVTGDQALVDCVKRCWASLWNPRAVHYRKTIGSDDRQSSMAVVVQQLIAATAAGVLFTANPVSGNEHEIVIESAWGLGEGVVSGAIQPDMYILDRPSGSIKSRRISRKDIRFVPATGQGVVAESVERELREFPSLSDRQVARLAQVAGKIEDRLGTPSDIEWCFDGDRLFVLQSRPITGLNR